LFEHTSNFAAKSHCDESSEAQGNAPLGYNEAMLADYSDDWSDNEPCPCATFDGSSSNNVKYQTSVSYVFTEVTLTASNNAGFANLEDAFLTLYYDDGSSKFYTIASLVQGEDKTIELADDSSQRGISGNAISLYSANPFEFCGFNAYGYSTPENYYAEMVASISDEQEKYDELSASYDYMSMDFFTKNEAKNSLAADYDLLESDYDDVVEYIATATGNTELVAGRTVNLGLQYDAVTDAYDLAVIEADKLDAANVVADSNIDSYSAASTMSEKCMIGPIFGWFWYCREGDALAREEADAEDAEDDEEEVAEDEEEVDEEDLEEEE